MKLMFNTNAGNGERIPASSARHFDRLAMQSFFLAEFVVLSPGLVTSEGVYTINGRAPRRRAET